MRQEQPYQVVARRFRPRSFGEVVGQEAILSALEKALASGRVPHAFLFSGSRGVGKTTSARILARALNCAKGPTPKPCGKCDQCTSILGGTNPDVIEIDAASHNMVDDIRELRDRVGFAAMGARYKVYILDEAHMLTRNAFNALLKTLEEPPPNVVFVLATTELQKVPETIRSRCQVLLFRRVSEADIEKRLAMICEHEKVALDPEVLAEIARDARGGMRDAETALERVLAVARAGAEGGTFDVAAWRELQGRMGGERALEVVVAVARGEAGPALRFCDAVIAAGVDERDALGEVLELLRSALLLLVDGKDTPLVAAGGALREQLLLVANAAGIERLDAMIQAGILGRDRLRRLEDRRLVLELSLLRMAQAGSVPLLGELLAAAREGRELEPEATEAQAPRRTFGAGAAASSVPPAAKAAQQPAPPSQSQPPPQPQSPPQQPSQRAPAPKSESKALPGASGPALRQELLRRMQLVRPLFAATIELCQLQGPDPAGAVTLRLVTDKKLHLDRLGSDSLQKELAQMLTEIVGRPVTLRVEVEAAPAPEAPARPGGPRPPPGPAVRRVQQMFDGTIVEDVERPTS